MKVGWLQSGKFYIQLGLWAAHTQLPNDRVHCKHSLSCLLRVVGSERMVSTGAELMNHHPCFMLPSLCSSEKLILLYLGSKKSFSKLFKMN